jgi:DNA-binding NarL/FixJ family response regulator
LESPVDLLLLDLEMPDMNGLEGFYTIRRHYPDLPMAIVSGVNDARIIRTLLDAGARGYIPKFAGSEQLMDALRHILQGDIYLPGELFIPESRFTANDGVPPADIPPTGDSSVAGRRDAQQADCRYAGSHGRDDQAASEGFVQAPRCAQPY